MSNMLEADKLEFFDANCVVGPFQTSMPHPGMDWTAASLIKVMDKLHIKEVAPSSAISAEYNIEAGNNEILKEAAGNDRLHPVWVLAPHHTGEMPAPRELVSAMKKNGIKAGKLLLGAFGGYSYRLELFLYEKLFDELAKEKIPLIMYYYSAALIETDAGSIFSTLEKWPDMHIILSFPKMEQEERIYYSLFERFKNFHVLLSGYQMLGGIEKIVSRFGAGPLIYGSDYPWFTPLQSMLQLIYSDISEEDKKLIAGGTFRSLMKNAYNV